MYKGCLPAKRSSSFAKGEMARFESMIRSAPPFPAEPLLFVTDLDESLATSSPASRELPLKGKPLSGQAACVHGRTHRCAPTVIPYLIPL